MTFDDFIMTLTCADGASARKAYVRIYSFLLAIANAAITGDVKIGDFSSECPETFLHDLIRDLKNHANSDHVDPDFTGLRHVVDRAFQDLDPQMDSISKSLLLQRINGILTRRRALDQPDWSWHVIGPALELDCLDKISARSCAMELQREFRRPCMSATTMDDLLRSRGALIETPCSPYEILLIGLARGRGLEVVGIGDDPDGFFMKFDIPFHANAHEAFKDLMARSAINRPVDDSGIDLGETGLDLLPALSPDAERAAWELRAEIIEQAYVALKRSATYLEDSHAGRRAEIDKLMLDEDTPEYIRTAYFHIVANGSRMGESPVMAQKISGMRHRIEALEKKNAALERKIAIHGESEDFDP